jgi:WD40 repeat protein
MLILKAHGGKKVMALAFSPDGQLLASSGLDDWVRVWSPPADKSVRKFEAESMLGAPVAFSPDGRYLAFGGRRNLCLWSAPDGEVNETYGDEPRDLAFLPSGKYVIALCDFTVARWEIPSGDESARWGDKLFRNVRSDVSPQSGLAVSPDGKTVAVSYAQFEGEDEDADGDESAFIALADAATGKVKSRLPAPPTSDDLDRLAFSPDGRQLVWMCGKSLYVWDMKAPKKPPVRRTVVQPFRDLAFTPDGRRLVTVGKEKVARMWDAAKWKEASKVALKIGNLRSVAVAPDGSRIAAGSDTGKVAVWDADG